MLEDNDIQKLIKAQKEVFVTKEEFEGFMEVNAKKFEQMGERFDRMDKKLDEIAGLKHRVEYIENTLNIQPLKS